MISATAWGLFAALAAMSLVTAGESASRVVSGMVALALFGFLAARCLGVGYVAAPQGLVVIGVLTRRVIPWRHIIRVEARPHRLTAQADPQASDLVWVARIDYGRRQCAPLFTVRSRRAAQRLAATLVSEVLARR